MQPLAIYAKWYDHNQGLYMQLPTIEAAFKRLSKFEGKRLRVVVVRGAHKRGCKGNDVSEYNPRSWSVEQVNMMEGLA